MANWEIPTIVRGARSREAMDRCVAVRDLGVRAGRTEFGCIEPRAVENEWNDLADACIRSGIEPDSNDLNQKFL